MSDEFYQALASPIIYSLNPSVVEEMYIQLSDLLNISKAGKRKMEITYNEARNENENNRNH